MIVFGFIVTYFGRKFLPWVVSIVSGTVVFFIVLLLASVFGWLDYIDPT